MTHAEMIQKRVVEFYKILLSTVKSIMRRYKFTSTVITSKKVGRKHKLGTRCVTRLLNYVRHNNNNNNNNKLPLYMIALNFKTANGTKVSFRTIRR